MKIPVTARIALDEDELVENFLRAGGPGGQNVNKVETAVQLRFAAMASPNLPDWVKEQLQTLAGRRMTTDGVIVISANRFRSQEQNRTDARDRLFALIQQACQRDPPRRPTRPTLASKRRRVEGKLARSVTKQGRSKVSID